MFVAEQSAQPSQKLSSSIMQAISDCDLFVLVWSANARASDWVSQEIGQAQAQKKQILPLMLSDGMALTGFIGELKFLPVYSTEGDEPPRCSHSL